MISLQVHSVIERKEYKMADPVDKQIIEEILIPTTPSVGQFNRVHHHKNKAQKHH